MNFTVLWPTTVRNKAGFSVVKYIKRGRSSELHTFTRKLYHLLHVVFERQTKVTKLSENSLLPRSPTIHYHHEKILSLYSANLVRYSLYPRLQFCVVFPSAKANSRRVPYNRSRPLSSKSFPIHTQMILAYVAIYFSRRLFNESFSIEKIQRRASPYSLDSQQSVVKYAKNQQHS